MTTPTRAPQAPESRPAPPQRGEAVRVRQRPAAEVQALQGLGAPLDPPPRAGQGRPHHRCSGWRWRASRSRCPGGCPAPRADTTLIVAGQRSGKGIDFVAIGHILAIVLVLYLSASLFTWLQGYVLNQIVQRRVRALRAEVQAKMNRLPLSYFDLQPRGELLSRVTNDIDNVATSLQQTLSQILNSALSAVGVLVMLVVISPLLAIIALVTVPLSVTLTAKIGKRSQKRFVAQWKHVGALNGQIEEAFTGHALVKVFGRRREIEARFRAKNTELYEASFRAQFISSIIMPRSCSSVTSTTSRSRWSVVCAWCSGAMSLGDVQAFIQYSRMFTQNLSQLAQVANILQSGVASAERVFEVLDAAEQSAEVMPPATNPQFRGEVRFEHVGFRYKPEQPLIEDSRWSRCPARPSRSSGRPAPARPRW